MVQEKEKKEKFSLVEVATETGVFIKDDEEDKILDEKAVLVKVLNNIEKILKILSK
jgi:hypothetical protein